MITNLINKYPAFRRLAALLVLLLIPVFIVVAIVGGTFAYIKDYAVDIYTLFTVEVWGTIKGLFKTIATGKAF